MTSLQSHIIDKGIFGWNELGQAKIWVELRRKISHLIMYNSRQKRAKNLYKKLKKKFHNPLAFWAGI